MIAVRRKRLLAEILEQRNLLTTIGFTGPFEMSNWTSSGIEGGTTTISPDSGPSDTAMLSYEVDLGNPANGVSQRTAGFSLVNSTVTGSISYDYEFTGNHSYYQAYATFGSGGSPELGFGGFTTTAGAISGEFTFSGSETQIVKSGDSLSFTVGGRNFDSISRIAGTLTITNFVANSSLLVDALGDVDDGDHSQGNLTLREAIRLANDFPGADTISFDTNGVFATAQTIVLGGVELQVTDALTIEGPGRDSLTIDAGGQSAIFDFDDGDRAVDSPAIIRGVTLTGGNSVNGGAIESFESLTVDTSTITNNVAALSGGGIDNFGDLTINNSLLTGNTSGSSGGGARVAFGDLTVFNSTISGNTSSGAGGGIAFDGTFDSASRYVTITDTTFQSNSSTASDGGGLTVDTAHTLAMANARFEANTAALDGGGLVIDTSTASINESDFINNSTGDSYRGGGIFAVESAATISTTTFRDNTAHYGGGLANLRGSSTINSSAFVDNRANSAGGAIWNWSDLSGNSTKLIQATISGNSSPTGGGAFNREGLLEIEHSTITLNTADLSAGFSNGGGISSWYTPSSTRTTVKSSIVARNINGDVDIEGTGDNTFVSNGFNLIGFGGSVSSFTNNDTTGVGDPFLGPLADNGGSTVTHQPLATSPAVDGGDPLAMAGQAEVPILDARGVGFPRVFGGRIDIGAVEFSQFNGPLVVDSLADGIDHDYTDGQLTLREAVDLANNRMGADEITFSADLFSSGDAMITLTEGQIAITDSATVLGPTDSAITIVADTASRIFLIDDGEGTVDSTVTLQNLTLTGGNTSDSGGAVFTRENLSVAGSTITGNTAMPLPTLGYPTLGGGGIYGVAGTTISIMDSTISGNTSGDSGGGVQGDIVTIINSVIRDNMAAQLGGGVNGFSTNGYGLATGTVTVTNSTVTNNSSDFQAGGIGGFNVIVTDSNVSGNTAALLGGGIGAYSTTTISGSTVSGNESQYRGGGIASFLDVTLSSSTVSGNSSADQGGGVFVFTGNATIAHSTVVENDAGNAGGGISLYSAGTTVTLDHAIVAANTRSGSPNDLSGVANATFSFIGTNDLTNLTEASVPDANGNLIGGAGIDDAIDPMLEALADSGGMIFTHRPAPGSPVIDAGDSTLVAGVGNVPEFDQRGESRIAGQSIDIGAIEVQALGWHNAANPLDVNNDGNISPLDALLVINEMNDRQFSTDDGRLFEVATPPPFFDVDPDGFISPLDALLVINDLPSNDNPEPPLSFSASKAVDVATSFNVIMDKSNERDEAKDSLDRFFGIFGGS